MTIALPTIPSTKNTLTFLEIDSDVFLVFTSKRLKREPFALYDNTPNADEVDRLGKHRYVITYRSTVGTVIISKYAYAMDIV